jgi:hypothetical protein
MRNTQSKLTKVTSKFLLGIDKIVSSAVLTSPLFTRFEFLFTDGIKYSSSTSTNNVTWTTRCTGTQLLSISNFWLDKIIIASTIVVHNIKSTAKKKVWEST